MALRNRHTVVSVHFAPWHEDAYTGYAEKPVAQRVHKEPNRLKEITLASGGLLLGCNTAASPNKGWQSFDFASPHDELVSGIGFEIREDLENGHTHVLIRQACTSQLWGQATSKKLLSVDLPTIDIVRVRSQSYRIDGQRGSYWILIEPGIRILPTPVNGDDHSSNPVRLTKTGESVPPELLGEFRKLLPLIEVYFGQYLEWPPRVNPVRERKLEVLDSGGQPLPPVDDGGIGDLKVFDGKLSHVFGYTKWDQAGAPPEMIEWLTAQGVDMPFHKHRQPSRIGRRTRR